MNIEHLKLTIFAALLGNVSKNVRALAFDFTDTKIIIYGYLDNKPCDDDYESVDIIITEIMSTCSDFTEQDIILTESHQPVERLPSYKGWVFVRKE